MNIVPNWHDGPLVPTVGDAVVIRHIITVYATRELPDGFRMAVQPRSKTGELSEQAAAIFALIRTTHVATSKFLGRYVRGEEFGQAELDDLRVDLKNLLENYRSALEYVAHYVADRCSPRPAADKVHFPVADPEDTVAKFKKKLDRWFPGLAAAAPAVRAHLVAVQKFGGRSWLRMLAELTNVNKHRTLSPQERRRFESIVVRFRGAGVRLGELGFHSLEVVGDGCLRFEKTNDQFAALHAPAELSVKSLSWPRAEGPIEVVREVRELYSIPGSAKSIAHAVWVIDKHVCRAVNKICSLLS
jgi:hypothetical protein